MTNLGPRYSDQPLPVDDQDALVVDDDMMDLPVSSEKHSIFKGILKNILPYLGSDEGKIVITEVMIALKLEGVIGKELSHGESKMVNIIKESILLEPRKKRQALRIAQQLLENNHDVQL